MYDQNQQIEYKTITCVVCNSSKNKPLFYIPPRHIVECINCGHEYASSYPKRLDYFFLTPEENSPGAKIDLCYLTKIFSKYDLVNCKLLDLGCGPGRLEKGLIEAGWDQKNLYLMEVSESSIDVLQKKYPAAHFILGDAEENIGFDNYFDCILMVEFLEDLINPRKVMENALKALKTNGLLIIRGLPNNKSLESFIGKDRWKMRLFECHYHFFNPDTFLVFAKNFPNIQVLEFGCFLQKGFHFYNIQRLAKNIGIIKESINKEQPKSHDGQVIDDSKLTDLVLKKLSSTDFDTYSHKNRIPRQQLDHLSSTREVEEFFDKVHLDYLLSPDFSVIIRKVRGH